MPLVLNLLGVDVHLSREMYKVVIGRFKLALLPATYLLLLVR